MLQFRKMFLCLVQCLGRVRELLSFLEKSRKTFLQFDLQKKFVKTLKIHRNVYWKNLSAIVYRLPISILKIEIYRIAVSPRDFLNYRLSLYIALVQKGLSCPSLTIMPHYLAQE